MRRGYIPRSASAASSPHACYRFAQLPVFLVLSVPTFGLVINENDSTFFAIYC
jgi:hypothetical protein